MPPAMVGVVRNEGAAFPDAVGVAGIEDVRLERIKVRFPGAGSTSVANVPFTALAKIPEYAEHYPEFNMFGEMPAWALFVRHAKGISIKDCSFSADATDYRPAVV